MPPAPVKSQHEAHEPLQQTAPAPHAVPHPPQFNGSDVVSVHVVPHRVRPEGQTPPEWQPRRVPDDPSKLDQRSGHLDIGIALGASHQGQQVGHDQSFHGWNLKRAAVRFFQGSILTEVMFAIKGISKGYIQENVSGTFLI